MLAGSRDGLSNTQGPSLVRSLKSHPSTHSLKRDSLTSSARPDEHTESKLAPFTRPLRPKRVRGLARVRFEDSHYLLPILINAHPSISDDLVDFGCLDELLTLRSSITFPACYRSPTTPYLDIDTAELNSSITLKVSHALYVYAEGRYYECSYEGDIGVAAARLMNDERIFYIKSYSLSHAEYSAYVTAQIIEPNAAGTSLVVKPQKLWLSIPESAWDYDVALPVEFPMIKGEYLQHLLPEGFNILSPMCKLPFDLIHCVQPFFDRIMAIKTDKDSFTPRTRFAAPFSSYLRAAYGTVLHAAGGSFRYDTPEPPATTEKGV